MKKPLTLLLLLLMALPLWAQRTYGELTTDELRRQANQGDATAQVVLGFRYEEGDRVTKDYQLAVYWYTKAANQGDATAQGCIGDCYLHGHGVEKDCSKALEWYNKAKANGAIISDYDIRSAKDCIKQSKRR